MARDSWFYAVDNTEQGPVSLAELKSLAAAEKIAPRTLVWQEGLPDWIAAEKVPGLFGGAAAPAPPAAPSVTGSRASKADAWAKDDAPAKPSEPATKPASAAPPLNSPTTVNRVRPPAISTAEILGWVRRASLLLFGVGLAFMLLARGCDSLSLRYAARLQAQAQVAELQFRDEWDATRTDLEAKRDEATKKNAAESAEAYNERLTKLSNEKTAEQERLRRGSWRTLAQSARDADANYKMWSFWREGLFVFGLLLLTLGAATAGFTGTGPERWFFLVILGGIILSLLGSAVAFRFGG